MQSYPQTPLTTNNPRLIKAIDDYNNISPSSFIDKWLFPFVSKEHAEQWFLGFQYYKSGDFSYGINDQTLTKDILFWIGISKLLGYAIRCCEKGQSGEELKIEIKYSASNQFKKVWHIQYNEYLSCVFLTVNASLWNDYRLWNTPDHYNYKNDRLEYGLKKAEKFALDVTNRLLSRLQEVSSSEVYKKHAYDIVIPCAF